MIDYKYFLAVMILMLSSAGSVMAHSAGGILGADASATDLAIVQCYDDGNGKPDHLSVQIEDLSPPQENLMVNMQILKSNSMTNITDTVSGDGKPSALLSLQSGAGIYFISVNKTGQGPRSFIATWHCETSTNAHTGSEADILQIQ